MLPPAGVVTSPHRGVALNSSAACTGDYERARIGQQLGERLSRGLAHQIAVGIVHVGVLHLGAGVAMEGGLVERARVGCEVGRLVHVIPYSANARIEQSFVVVGPPYAACGPCEIGISDDPRPDTAFIYLPVRSSDEHMLAPALPVHWVSGVDLHARVYYGHYLETVFAKVGYQAARVGEMLRIEGEYPEPVHVVDVEVDGIAWYVGLSHRPSYFAHLAFRAVAEPALVIAECPKRRQLHSAGQVRIGVHDI